MIRITTSITRSKHNLANRSGKSKGGEQIVFEKENKKNTHTNKQISKLVKYQTGAFTILLQILQKVRRFTREKRRGGGGDEHENKKRKWEKGERKDRQRERGRKREREREREREKEREREREIERERKRERTTIATCIAQNHC